MRKILSGLASIFDCRRNPGLGRAQGRRQGARLRHYRSARRKAVQAAASRELKKGPVVLYFFPKAFTKGCTLEAHAFSEASADFAKMGAHVIGMSADDLATLKRFSVEECRNAFPVATATKPIIKAYDVGLACGRDDQPHQLCHRPRRAHRNGPFRNGLEPACREVARRGEGAEALAARPIYLKYNL